MSPSAKRNTAVLESSNKFENPRHSNVITSEAPHSYGGAPLDPEDPNEKREKTKKSRFSTRARIGALAAGVTIIGGAVAGGIFASQPAPEAPSTSQSDEGTTEEVPVDGNETETNSELWYETMNLEPTAEDIRIDAATVAPEDVPAAYYNNMSTWLNAGYSTDLTDVYFDTADFRGTVALPVAAQYDDLFIENTVSSTPDLAVKNVINTVKFTHGEDLMMSVMTSFPDDINENDKVPYMRGIELVDYTNLVVGEDGSVTFTATANEYDNSDQNSVDEDTRFSGNYEGGTYTQTVKLVVEDGAYKLSSIS